MTSAVLQLNPYQLVPPPAAPAATNSLGPVRVEEPAARPSSIPITGIRPASRVDRAHLPAPINLDESLLQTALPLQFRRHPRVAGGNRRSLKVYPAALQCRKRLEEINEFILYGEGEIVEVPGKLSLVWTDPVYEIQRFLAVKAAGEESLLINGRRYPATAEGLKMGLRACLVDLRRAG